jgi:hypothetical protein
VRAKNDESGEERDNEDDSVDEYSAKYEEEDNSTYLLENEDRQEILDFVINLSQEPGGESGMTGWRKSPQEI